MATNSSNQDYSNASDGFTLGGGTTKRTLTVTGGNATITASGTNVYTMPAATDTLVGRASTDTLTNKTIDAAGTGNSVTNVTTLSTRKQTNATNATITGTRIESGIAGITNGTSKAITFNTAFTSAPIVAITNIGGDGTSATFAYPAANAAAFTDRVYSAVSQSTTGFTAQMTGAATSSTQIAEFTWIAIGN